MKKLFKYFKGTTIFTLLTLFPKRFDLYLKDDEVSTLASPLFGGGSSLKLIKTS